VAGKKVKAKNEELTMLRQPEIIVTSPDHVPEKLSQATSGKRPLTQITVIDHTAPMTSESPRSKVAAVKELLGKSKISYTNATGSRKLFKLPMKIVNDCNNSANTSINGESQKGNETSKGNKPSLFEQLKARLTRDNGGGGSATGTGAARNSFSAGPNSIIGSPKSDKKFKNSKKMNASSSGSSVLN